MGWPPPLPDITPDGPTEEGNVVREVFGPKIRARWVNGGREGRFLFVEGDVLKEEDWMRMVEVHRRLPDTDAKIVLATIEEIRRGVVE